MFVDANRKIFVQIASYRDPELQPTLDDLFAKADRPERVTVGICLQIDPSRDADCDYSLPEHHTVRCLRVPAAESRGVCWARSQIGKLWNGEEFTLQIDSHMRFERGWDTLLISQYRACRSPKSILSTYPPTYTPPDLLQDPAVTLMQPSRFDPTGILLMESIQVAPENAPRDPLPGFLTGACFLFAPSELIREVPYDPELYFFGEEISMTVRYWTNGWDIFHPGVPVCYHHWEREYRRVHWEDSRRSSALDKTSREKVLRMLGGEIPAGNPGGGNSPFGLGTERTLADYENFSGIDFRARTFKKEPWLDFSGRKPEEPLGPFTW